MVIEGSGLDQKLAPGDQMTADQTLPDLVARLQRRVARLLLRHDRRTFRGRFRELYAASALPQLPDLRAYDRYIRLIALADELFDDLLPRVRRQMSFAATRQTLDEESPLRGQIDWSASLRRGWNEQPDQAPTRFVTQLRQRTFGTPENLLVVAILQAYARQLSRASNSDLFVDAPLVASEQRELAQLIDRVRRELATIHFQEIARAADDLDVDDLIERVEPRLRSGTNPYRDLIDWWRRLNRLHLRRRTDDHATDVLHSDDQLGLLYQLWIALELVDLLAERRVLLDASIEVARLTFRFRWQERHFRLVYDRQPTPHQVWINAPGERPDYFITRDEPLLVAYDGAEVWREPGVVLDAKCYLGSNADRATGPIKRMIADLDLIDAAKGILLLPNTINLDSPIHPQADRYLGNAQRDMEVQLHQISPTDQIGALHDRLARALDQVARWLPERPAIACYGTLLDRDTINPHATPSPSCDRCGGRLALCPKPHIGPRRADQVCPRCDCLSNAHVCHIMSLGDAQTLVPPFVKRVLTREQLTEAINNLRAQLRRTIPPDDQSDEAEQARTNLINAIGELTDSYLKLKQPDTTQIAEKLEWMFGAHWQHEQHPRGLPQQVRDMLISGEYVWADFKHSSVQDWAACAVQYVRAIERELHRRLYDRFGTPSPLVFKGSVMQPRNFTFGTVDYAYKNRNNGDKNWNIWITRNVQPSGATAAQFEQVITPIAALRDIRNQIAHSEAIDQMVAEHVRNVTLGTPTQPGSLIQFVAMLDA
jgi:hypothetical protein